MIASDQEVTGSGPGIAVSLVIVVTGPVVMFVWLFKSFKQHFDQTKFLKREMTERMGLAKLP